MVEVRLPQEEELVIHPAAPGECGPWPWPSLEPVHLLTAWDPGSERPGEHVNRARQVELEAELRLGSHRMWAAIGIDPATGRREEGVAVQGIREPEVLALASRYRQDAIFTWTPSEWIIVAAAGDRRLTSGWSLDPPRSMA